MVHKKRKARTMLEIHKELMRESKSYRESTPRSREIRQKRLHMIRNKNRSYESPSNLFEELL